MSQFRLYSCYINAHMEEIKAHWRTSHTRPVMSMLEHQSKQLISPGNTVWGVLDTDSSPATQGFLATVNLTEMKVGHVARG